MPRLAVLVLIVASACLSPDTETCGDGSRCPSGKRCDDVHRLCIDSAQQTACSGRIDGERCEAGGNGVCDRGVCIFDACGDGIIGYAEACDDGGQVGGDGCSADCRSTERCGNAFLDDTLAIEAEQCDCGDGTVPLGAGCSEPNSDSPGAQCRTDCRTHCGDGVVNDAELCEPGRADLASCVDLGFDRGLLGCLDNCSLSFGQCKRLGWQSYQLGNAAGDIQALDMLADGRGYAVTASTTYRFDGSDWLVDREVGGSGVWATEDTDDDAVFVVGPGPAVARRVQGQWNDVDLGLTPPVDDELRWIWGSSADNVYVAGEAGTLLRFDGTTWTRESSPGPVLKGLWGLSANDVYVVAPKALYRRTSSGIWQDTGAEAPVDDGELTDVHGLSPLDLWLVDTLGTIQRFDGEQWQPAPSDFGGELLSVHVLGPNRALLGFGNYIGRYLDGEVSVHAFAGNGLSSTGLVDGGPVIGVGSVVYTYLGSGRAQQFTLPGGGVFRLAATTDRAYAVTDQNSGWRLLRWAGVWWQELETNTNGLDLAIGPDDKLYMARVGPARISVWDAEDVGPIDYVANCYNWAYQIAVPAAGLVAVAAGDKLALVDEGTCVDIGESPAGPTRGVWAASPTEIYFTVDDEIHLYNGSTSERQDTASVALSKMWGHGQHVYAVGENGIVRHFDGDSWQSMVVPAKGDLASIHGSSPEDMVVSTENGHLWHFDGAQWSEVRGQQTTGYDLAVLPDTLFVTGEFGVDIILRDQSWTLAP